MAVFVGGLVTSVVFYFAILAVGIWAGFKQKNNSEEEVMMAGKSIGLVVGLLTLIATWVGGGYINGVAECMFSSDVASCQMPIGYSLSILLGSLLFVNPLREGNFITMLDPFQKLYGTKAGTIMLIPNLISDVLWSASVLNALGSSLMIILNIDMTISVIVSAGFAAAYTLAGGLYGVTYTDVIQIFFIVFGLIVSVSFAFNNPNVSRSEITAHDWGGRVETSTIGTWIDTYLLLICGGPSSQAYVQRVLCMKSTRATHILSVVGVFGTLAVAVPPALAGVAGRVADWENVPGFNRNVTNADAVYILPLVLRYLTPEWVACIGLGAISAAALSSSDACMLSSSSLFARNIYKVAIRPQASEFEVVWVLRFSIVVVTIATVTVALTVKSIYYLSILSSDLVYVILFPHLLLAVRWTKYGNTYGFLSSFFLGVLLRLLSGEPALGLPAVVLWPLYDRASHEQQFPFKTSCMVFTAAVHVGVSLLARRCFERGWLSADRWDVLGAFPHCLEGNLLLQMWPPCPRAEDLSFLAGTAGKYGLRNPALLDGEAQAPR